MPLPLFGFIDLRVVTPALRLLPLPVPIHGAVAATLPVPRLALAMKGRRLADFPLPTLEGLGPREARQDKAVSKCLVVTGSGGGLSHCLAKGIPKILLMGMSFVKVARP